MRDRLGNTLEAGHHVHWEIPKPIAEGGILAMVVKVLDARIKDQNGNPLGQEAIILQLYLPVTRGSDNQPEAVLPEFMRVVTPLSEKVINDMFGRIPTGATPQ
jgi:hypothetical protein